MKQNECKGYEEWMEGHITEVPFTPYNLTTELTMYIAWDETGSDIIRVSTSLQEVVTALKTYGKRLSTGQISRELKKHPDIKQIVTQLEDDIIQKACNYIINAEILPENVYKLSFKKNPYRDGEIEIRG